MPCNFKFTSLSFWYGGWHLFCAAYPCRTRSHTFRTYLAIQRYKCEAFSRSGLAIHGLAFTFFFVRAIDVISRELVVAGRISISHLVFGSGERIYESSVLLHFV